MKRLLLTAFAASLLFAACKKSESDNSRRSVLTTGKWRNTALTAVINIFGKDTTVDVFSTMDACSKDDYVIFNGDGTVTNDEGATKCSAGAPQQSPGGNWSLNNSEDVLTLSGGTYPGSFKILSFSSSSMQLQADTNYIGIPAKVNATLVHE